MHTTCWSRPRLMLIHVMPSSQRLMVLHVCVDWSHLYSVHGEGGAGVHWSMALGGGGAHEHGHIDTRLYEIQGQAQQVSLHTRSRRPSRTRTWCTPCLCGHRGRGLAAANNSSATGRRHTVGADDGLGKAPGLGVAVPVLACAGRGTEDAHVMPFSRAACWRSHTMADTYTHPGAGCRRCTRARSPPGASICGEV
jgi:hypothetical protein